MTHLWPQTQQEKKKTPQPLFYSARAKTFVFFVNISMFIIHIFASPQTNGTCVFYCQRGALGVKLGCEVKGLVLVPPQTSWKVASPNTQDLIAPACCCFSPDIARHFYEIDYLDSEDVTSETDSWIRPPRACVYYVTRHTLLIDCSGLFCFFVQKARPVDGHPLLVS